MGGARGRTQRAGRGGAGWRCQGVYDATRPVTRVSTFGPSPPPQPRGEVRLHSRDDTLRVRNAGTGLGSAHVGEVVGVPSIDGKLSEDARSAPTSRTCQSSGTSVTSRSRSWTNGNEI